MTKRRTATITGASVRSGQRELVTIASPAWSNAKPRYIGLRVKRYGPVNTIAVVGRMGFGVVSARWNNRTAQIGSMMLAVINTQPTARATKTSPLPVGTGRTGQYQCNRYPAPIPAA